MSEWRPFPFCPKYEVSDAGHVRHAASGRIMAGSPGKSGYLYVNFRPDGKHGRHVGYTVHRMVAITFLGPRPAGQSVDHINRNRTDNRLSNLRYLSSSENSSQGGVWHRGKSKPAGFGRLISAANTGAKHPGAKLTEIEAAEILRRRRAGESLELLAKEFAISRTMIYNIHSGKAWKHLSVAGTP